MLTGVLCGRAMVTGRCEVLVGSAFKGLGWCWVQGLAFLKADVRCFKSAH